MKIFEILRADEVYNLKCKSCNNKFWYEPGNGTTVVCPSCGMVEAWNNGLQDDSAMPTSKEILVGGKIAHALGLGDRVTWFQLTMGCGMPPKVQVEMTVDAEQLEAIPKIIRECKLRVDGPRG